MAENNPYVGQASFTERDRRRFFGRDEDARELSYLLIERRAVLLYAQSGAGKTSLLQAKVVPELRDAGEMKVLPITRVMGPVEEGNVFVANALAGLGMAGATLTEGLAPLFHGHPEGEEEIPHLLIFDQFEEVFTFHPDLVMQRRAFFEQLRDCLEAYPKLGLLISMREDHLADMDSFAGYFPDRLRTRMRMERLTDEQAEEAIGRPAAGAGKPFVEGAARMLADDLRRIQTGRRKTLDSTEQGDVSQELGKYVEPVLMQIVCSRLWSRLENSASEITQEDVEEKAQVDDALTGLYRDSLDAVRRKVPSQSERVLRRWFEENLITTAKMRGIVYQGDSDTGGLPNLAVQVLAGKYILRADSRASGVWYELAHDRLVEPILADNFKWREEHHNPVEKGYERWRYGGLLLSGAQLTEASQFADDNPAELTANERDFLEKCTEAQRREEDKHKQAEERSQRARWTAIVMCLVALGFAGLGGWAWQKAREAENESSRVVLAEGIARENLDRAKVSQAAAEESAQRAGLALARSLVRHGVRLYEQGEFGQAAAHLASALRRAPESVPALSWMSSLFLHAEWWLPGAPLQHGRIVLSAAFSPDGRRVVTASGDNTARVWDADTGKPVGAPLQHQDRVRSAAFSPDGRRVVTASEDKTAQVWEADTGKRVGAPLQHQAHVRSAAFSPDGRLVLTASHDNTARLWQADTGQPVGALLIHKNWVFSAAFSPDGRRVVTASEDGTARFWEADTGEPVGVLLQHQGEVHSAAFSQSGRRVVTASEDGTARLWDADTYKPIGAPFQHGGIVRSAAFSPDGRRVVTASDDKTARVWDAYTGKPVGAPLQHGGSVHSAAFSRDGGRVLTASEDGTARLWEAETGKPVGAPLQHQDRVRSAAFSPNGRRVVTASDDMTARVWEANTGKPAGAPLEHNHTVRSAAFSPDGRRIVTHSDDNSARVWEADTGKPAGAPLQHQNRVRSAAFSPDGRRVVTASDDMTARVWEANTGKGAGAPLQHRSRVISAAFSLDGRRVVTASEDKTAQVWEADTGKPAGAPLQHQGEVHYAAFSPDGRRIVTAADDMKARVWEADTGKPVGAPLQHQAYVSSAAFSPDGRRVVTASFDDTARVWEADTGKPAGAPLQHQSSVNSAAFSPDGRRVVTASFDNTARVWEADTGKPVGAPLQHQSHVFSASFSPDGRRVVTSSYDNTAQVWDADTGKPVGAPFQHEHWVLSAAFSPDGRRVVTASNDGTARVWSVLLNCCASQQETERLARLAEVLSGWEISETGSLSIIGTDKRREMLENLRSSRSGNTAERLSVDWLIDRFTRRLGGR